MSDKDWERRFREVYDRAIEAFQASDGGAPEECISEADRQFLASIGCSPQELYDFVEDWCWSQEPSFEEVLAVTAIRRDYYLRVQDGKAPERRRPPHEFPPGTATAAGIPWLPRLLAKARAKLRGELPPQLMYGCGGDRPFLERAGVGLAQFLAAVRDAGDDDQPVIQLIKKSIRSDRP